MKVEFVQIDRSELPKIQNLAKRIWPNTFSEILSVQQIDFMLDWMYDLAKMEIQMNAGHEFYLLKDGKIEIGFAGVEWNFPSKGLLRIHKLYLLPDYQGRGLGAFMIQRLEEISLAKKGNGLHLNVNRFNQAVHFYQKLDFRIVGEEDIDIGNGYLMEDYIMCKKW